MVVEAAELQDDLEDEDGYGEPCQMSKKGVTRVVNRETAEQRCFQVRQQL